MSMSSTNVIRIRLLSVLGLYALIPLAAIVLGLLIFFLGRRHVRKKYGPAPMDAGREKQERREKK